MKFDAVSYMMGKASGGGSVSGIPLLTSEQWEALTTEQKREYELVAIQDTDTGFERGKLVYGADYVNAVLLQSGTNQQSVLTSVSGHYKLFVLALNSEATSYDLNISASLNGNALIAETTEYHDYNASGINNKRNYRMNIYDLQTTSGDELEISLTQRGNYSSFVFGIIASDAWALSKVMTSTDSATSGANSHSGMVIYGTFNSYRGGTIQVAGYSSGTTVTTDNPGASYSSSYIFWFTQAES